MSHWDSTFISGFDHVGVGLTFVDIDQDIFFSYGIEFYDYI